MNKKFNETENIIKDLVSKSGLSKTQFRKITGITQSRFSNYMNGKTSVLLSTIYRAANAIGYEIEIILRKKK